MIIQVMFLYLQFIKLAIYQLLSYMKCKLSCNPQDEKTNLHQICLVQVCCKYELCTQCKCGDGRICPFLCKFGHCHLCTGCKALQISYLQHICTRQIWGKFDFSSSDRSCARSKRSFNSIYLYAPRIKNIY